MELVAFMCSIIFISISLLGIGVGKRCVPICRCGCEPINLMNLFPKKENKAKSGDSHG